MMWLGILEKDFKVDVGIILNMFQQLLRIEKTNLEWHQAITADSECATLGRRSNPLKLPNVFL